MDLEAFARIGGLMFGSIVGAWMFGGVCAVLLCAGRCPHCRRERRARAAASEA